MHEGIIEVEDGGQFIDNLNSEWVQIKQKGYHVVVALHTRTYCFIVTGEAEMEKELRLEFKNYIDWQYLIGNVEWDSCISVKEAKEFPIE